MYRHLLSSVIIAGSMLAVPLPALAATPPTSQAVQRVPAWNLAGNYVINFTCTYGCDDAAPHAITITPYDIAGGSFSGSGYAPVVGPRFTLTVSGTVSGNTVNMRLTYNDGYFVDLVGTINNDGGMSGTATDSSGNRFVWQTVSGHAFRYCNHGQFVSSQSDKRAAAQARFGMPVTARN